MKNNIFLLVFCLIIASCSCPQNIQTNAGDSGNIIAPKFAQNSNLFVQQIKQIAQTENFFYGVQKIALNGQNKLAFSFELENPKIDLSNDGEVKKLAHKLEPIFKNNITNLSSVDYFLLVFSKVELIDNIENKLVTTITMETK
ncbi:hypothetical protein SAMN05192588_1127 [Nonlabens sp. Hel1_33_55]|uniref:hypothetical protein n=1 Tax=Nonlabens sp. Hel1_33_55 TaxID=1336802 RepID=UPI000875D0EA|nr:hypothetical protein [Nonlabens sp. Hel1_33_55]SCY09624.1 hypothetical protein SAMN05192588_1127 [Nonlabens sp. Hel1_33_55]